MKLRWIIIAVAVLTLGLVAACGGDDDDDTPSTSASATATEKPDDEDTATPKRTATPGITVTDRPDDGDDDGGDDDDDSGDDDDDDDSGDDDDGAFGETGTPDIDECELVTLADLAAATGETFSEEGSPGFSDPDTCTWGSEEDSQVEITVSDLSSTGDVKGSFEFFAELFEDEILDDPGDEAYYDEFVGLAILDGDYEIDIYVQNADFESEREPAFALADVVLGNMP